MFLHKKALYNLIQLNLVKIPEHEIELEQWQRDNYRKYPIEALFKALANLNIHLDTHRFQEQSSFFDTPEEFCTDLASNLLPLEQDRVYLLIFELWRRLCPEKQSLTIFCDELDHQTVRYEQEGTQPFPEIQDALVMLQDVLDKNVDSGVAVSQALPLIQSFCANNLETFLYNYIADRIEEGNVSYAKELLDAFGKYEKDRLHLFYLSSRIEIMEDPEIGYDKLEKMLPRLKDKKALELSFDVLAFLAKTGNHSLFSQLAIQMIPLLQTEEDLRDLALISAQHFTYVELETLAKALYEFLNGRPPSTLGQPLCKEDPGLTQIRSILNQRVHFAIE